MPTIEQIQARVKKLQLQADAMIAKRKDAIIRQVQKLLTEYGLTAEDLGSTSKPRGRATAKNPSQAKF